MINLTDKQEDRLRMLIRKRSKLREQGQIFQATKVWNSINTLMVSAKIKAYSLSSILVLFSFGSLLAADTKTNIVTGVTPGWVTNQMAILQTNILGQLTNSIATNISGLSTNLILNSELLYQHQTAASVSGGTFTSGSWQTIPLNTEVLDYGNHGVITNTNDILLQAGSYQYNYWLLAAGDPLSVRGRITNLTAGVVITASYSQSTHFATTGGGFTFGVGRFTISASSQIRLQGIVGATCSFGAASNTDGANEVYSSLTLFKE